MKKTILTFAMMLVMAFASTAAPAKSTQPANKPHIEVKGDSAVITDKDGSVTVNSLDLQKVNQKIQEALDDTLTAGDGTTVEIGNHKGELTPEDIRAISGQWAVTSQMIVLTLMGGLLALVLLVLFFRFLNRRNKYRVIEKAIENNYPLNESILIDGKRNTIYVPQPMVTAPMPPMPPMANAAPAGPAANGATAAPADNQVPVGTPIGAAPAAPQVNPFVMADMFNWRALMPAVKWAGWGVALILFSFCIGDFENPFWPVGLALFFVGVCKGFILYKEQLALREACKRCEWQRQQEPMREGIPVPPPFDNTPEDEFDDPYRPE